MKHAVKNRTTESSPPASANPSDEGGGGGDSYLVIACRGIEDPREECSYCEELGTYKTRNGADPDFEPVCARHAGEFLTSMGGALSRLAPLPPQ